jgi:hypothetical protein
MIASLAVIPIDLTLSFLFRKIKSAPKLLFIGEPIL